MRKSMYEMKKDEAYVSFDKSPYATLTCIRENGLPYAVHLSIVREEETLYFHCACEGEKLEALQHNAHVCVASVEQYEYANMSTYYISTVIEGVATRVEDEEEKIKALKLITERFVPEQLCMFDQEVSKCLHVTCVYKIEITSITGKKKLKKQ